MWKVIGFSIALPISVAALGAGLFAQAPATPGSSFAKQQFAYDKFSSGRFSEVVTVSGPAKLVFLAGTGAWDPDSGAPLFKDNFIEQCRYSYAKVKKRLAEQGAGMSDIVRQTAYIVDVRNQGDYGKCRAEAFQGSALPASTGVYVSALAFPYMLFEVEITAAISN